MAMKLEESHYKLKEAKYHPKTRPFFRKEDQPWEDSKATESSAYDINKEYEIAIQKLEADARSHIRTGIMHFHFLEQQLKLHIESVHTKVDEAEEKWHLAESEKRKMQVDYEFELSKLKGKILYILFRLSHPKQITDFSTDFWPGERKEKYLWKSRRNWKIEG